MLDLRRTLLCLLLLCVGVASAAAAPTRAEKQRRAKELDFDGYSPVMAKTLGVEESEPNDLPAQADTLRIDESLGASFQSPGDVDWFLVRTDFAGYLRVSTSSSLGSLSDTVLEVYDASATVLLGSDDDSGLGLFSSIDHLPASPGTEFLVRVWNFDGSGGDAYQVVAEPGTPAPPVPANDTPAGAESVDCNSVVIGSTLGSLDDLPGAPCLGIETAGGEVFYRAVLPYSYQLNVQANPLADGFDPALLVFTDPGDPAGSCLVASDEAFSGEAEGVVYTNEEFEGGLEVYIAVDSWAPASAGDFVLDVKCDYVVPVQASTWSTLKANW
jgi:hypothetical protein